MLVILMTNLHKFDVTLLWCTGIIIWLNNAVANLFYYITNPDFVPIVHVGSTAKEALLHLNRRGRRSKKNKGK